MDPLDPAMLLMASAASTAAYGISRAARPIAREVKKDFWAAERFAQKEMQVAGNALDDVVHAIEHWLHPNQRSPGA
ncbi:hypothetical protein M407DRAFT_28141 [Tulasnella calospora MUT 4182]|uniref:Uncharacterized protein n=1 Tax=Tulasnella calospora MUT 4182 TaxID=1051891 RepID=A0A0C3LM13_9AGAM|nr:hypothetical protein M407DRAFT_28141 [Tulasnella calospora MUT 4182]